MPEGTQIMIIAREAFENMLLATSNYDKYRLINR